MYYVAKMENDERIIECNTMKERDNWIRDHRQKDKKGNIVLETGEVIENWYKGRTTIPRRTIHM